MWEFDDNYFSGQADIKIEFHKGKFSFRRIKIRSEEEFLFLKLMGRIEILFLDGRRESLIGVFILLY